MNICYVPQNYVEGQQTVCFFTGNIWKTPFFISIATQRELHNLEKGQKTLPRPYTIRTHQKVHSYMCHFGMAAEQTHSVKHGI